MSAPQKYRKKPVEIEAMQLTENNVRDVQAWCNSRGDHSAVVQWHYPFAAAAPEDRVGWLVVTTIHGDEAVVRPGDWVVPESEPGRFYPINAGIFAATYEAVSE